MVTKQLPYIFPDSVEEGFEGGGVAGFDDGAEFGQALLYQVELLRRVGVEEYLAQQIIVFAHKSLGDCHMALECGAGRGLVFHHGAEDEGRGEGYRQRVGDGLVVLLEGIFFDVKAEAAVDVAEEDFAEVVALADDDGVFVREVAQRGEGRAEHGVGRHEGVAAGGVELRQAGLHRRYVAEDGALGQVWHGLLEGLDGIFDRRGVDDKFGLEVLDFGEVAETLGVEGEAQAPRVGVVDGDLVVE